MNEDEYLKNLLLGESEDEEEKKLVKLLVKEEKPPSNIVAAIKKAGEITRAGGPYDPLSLKNWSKSWAWVNREILGDTDMPDWKDMTTAQHIWAGARVAVLPPAFFLLLQTGVVGVKGLREMYRFWRASKMPPERIVAAARQMKAKGKEVKFIWREYGKAKVGKAPLIKAKAQVVPKVPLGAPSMERVIGRGMAAPAEIAQAVKAKYAVTKVVKLPAAKDYLRTFISPYLKGGAPRAAPQAITSKATELVAKHTEFLPPRFDPKIMETVATLIAKDMPEAINELNIFAAKVPVQPEEVLPTEVKAAPIVKDAEEIQLRGFIEASTQFASVTQSQLHRINSLSESMNYNPRRMQRLLTLFASTTDLDKLSTEEADIVVRAMEAIPLTKHTKIPRIPTDINVDKMVFLDFLEKPKRGVGVIGAWGIPGHRVFDIIGARKEIYDPIMKAVIDKQVELHNKRDYYKELVKEGTVATNLSRHQVDSLLFEYLNNTLPKGTTIPPELEAIGKKARVVLDEFADRIGLPPERRLQNYIFHMFEHALTPDAGKTISEEVVSTFAAGIPKKVFTQTLLERLGKEEGLVRNFTRAMNAMTAIDLRKIHLEPAFEKARGYLPYYPEATQKWVTEWLDVTVLKRPAEIDMYISNTLKPVDDFLIRASKGKLSLGINPAKTLAYIYTRIGYSGLMAFNIAMAGKNVTQQMLILPLLRNPANYALAWKDIVTPRGTFLLRQCQTLKERFPGLEGVDATNMNWWLRIGMIPYKSVDWLNVSIAFLAGYRDGQKMGLSPEECVKHGDHLAVTSQYSYRLPDMPGYIWKGGGPGRVAGMLTTWADNYFGSYLPELFYRLYTGKDTEGNSINTVQRAGILTHVLTTAGFIYYMYKYRKIDFRKIFGPGVLPTYLSPALMNFIYLGKIMLGSQEESNRAKQQIGQNIKRFFIPTGLQSFKIHSALKNIADGFEKDSVGRFRRITSLEENIKSMYTYSAEKSEYWTVQETVWDLDAKINNIQKDVTRAALKGNRAKIQSLLEKAQRLAVKRNDFMMQLANLKQGLPRGKEDDLIRSLKELYLPRWARKFTL